MKIRKELRSTLDFAAMAVLSAGAFALRVIGPWRSVFRGGGVRFQESDPWYYARLTANLLHHFPRMIFADPFLLHPGGQAVPVTNFFDLAIAAAAWVLGLGHPSDAMALRVSALAPPLLGAFVVVPCYLMARTLGGRYAAVTAGALVAFLPGQFLERSLLGFLDHHVAEVLLTASCLAMIVVAVSPAEPEARNRHRGTRMAIGAGIALALYLLTWESGVFLVLVIGFWALVYGSPAGDEPDAAGVAMKAFLAATFALAIAAPFLPAARHGLLPVFAGAGVAAGIHFLRGRLSLLPRMLICLGAAALALVLLRLLVPERFAWLIAEVRRLKGSPESETVLEAVPYLRSAPYGLAFWRDYGSAFVLALAGAAFTARRAVRDRNAAAGIVVVWSTAALLLTLAQTRFAYYFAVAVAVLGSSLVGAVMPLFRTRRGASRLAIVGILVAFVGPGLRMAITSSRRFVGPNDEWVESLSWLRRNSAEPFGDPGFFDAAYPPSRDSLYGILSWWDYGYWIIGIAHRVPFTNPTQAGAEAAASILSDGDPVRAVAALRSHGLRYAMTDRSFPLTSGGPGKLPTGKFAAIVGWTGLPQERFFEFARYRDDRGRWRPVTLYYPEYFQSFMVRLQLYGGGAVTPQTDAVWAVAFKPGSSPLEIDKLTPIRTVEAAREFVAADPGHRKIASLDPLQSCVSLEEIPGLRRVHSSAGTFLRQGSNRIGNVEIFEIAPIVP